MSIHGIDGAGGAFGPGSIRPSQANEAPELSSGGEQEPQGRTARVGDRVEISATARALSAADVNAADNSAPADESQGLTAERLQTVLTRLQNGFYESPQVQQTTANNLLPDLRTLSTD